MISRIFQHISATITSNPLEFTARLGYAYEIIDVSVLLSAGLGVDVVIDGEKMAFIPGVSGKDAVASPRLGQVGGQGYFEYLRKKGFDIPRMIIAEGQTLSISAFGGATGDVSVIMIEHYGDSLPKNTDKGGSMSGYKLLISYGYQSYLITGSSTEIHRVTEDVNPAGYPLFPFTGAVLPKQRFQMLGLVTFLAGSSGSHIVYNGLRLWKQNQSVLAPAEAFLAPELFPATDEATNMAITVFEKPIVFDVNESALFDLSITDTDAGDENAIVGLIPIMQLIPAGA